MSLARLKRTKPKTIWRALCWTIALALAYFFLRTMGCGSLMLSYLPPHSRVEHGSTPPEFEGLWVMKDAEEHSTSAFALNEDGSANLMGGMQQFSWHFDDERLFIDSVSRCGSCWQGVRVREYIVKRESPDTMELAPQHESKSAFSNPMGTFERITVTDEYRKELQAIVDARNYADQSSEYWVSHYILSVIEQSEIYGFDYSVVNEE